MCRGRSAAWACCESAPMISLLQQLVTGDPTIPPTPGGKAADTTHGWVDLPDEALLDVRLCDLNVTIEGSWLEDRLADLHAELDERHLTF